MDLKNLSSFGNFIFTGLSGTALDNSDKRILETVQPAGILFLKSNIIQDAPYQVWLEAFANLIDEIKKYSGRKKILLSIDHEGGLVQRTPAPITNFGKPEAYARYAREVALASAEELKSFGINLSWAPSADINTNPLNPIIGKLGRSFSSKPEEVAAACVAYNSALRESGIISCAKHFPGHGDTWSDSHLELPEVKLTLEEARKRELLPFKALIDNGVPCVMTAHVMFTGFDSKNPATFSRLILQDVLRKELGFNGVIIADDINMRAIFDRIRTVEGLADSINAGVDTYIVGRFPEPEKDASPILLCNLLKEGLEKKLFSEERLLESVKRMDALLAKTQMYTPAVLNDDTLNRHTKLQSQIVAV